MKKEYREPIMEIELINNEDIVTTSNYGDELFSTDNKTTDWDWSK